LWPDSDNEATLTKVQVALKNAKNYVAQLKEEHLKARAAEK
jgi:hypothetical protein